MIFASKTPRDLNRDPEPYVSSAPDFERYEQAEDNPKVHPVIFDPRPEFDHPQNNKPNPILIAARRAIAEGATFRDIADDLLGYQVGYPGCEHISDAFDAGYRASAPDHARLIFTRLAQMEPRP